MCLGAAILAVGVLLLADNMDELSLQVVVGPVTHNDRAVVKGQESWPLSSLLVDKALISCISVMNDI